MEPKKVADILDLKAPRDVLGFKSFIGMAGYYLCFNEGFSKIARPMTTSHVLILSDVHKPFSVYCDASYTSLGCVLMQEGRVVAYSSRQLKIHEELPHS